MLVFTSIVGDSSITRLWSINGETDYDIQNHQFLLFLTPYVHIFFHFFFVRHQLLQRYYKYSNSSNRKRGEKEHIMHIRLQNFVNKN